MSCCPMCTGAAIWFKVAKVVIGDSVNFVSLRGDASFVRIKRLAR